MAPTNSFTVEEELYLIDFYQANPSLWDKRVASYKDRRKKRRLRAELARKFTDKTEDDVAKKWKTLVDTLRAETKKEKNGKNGSEDDRYRSVWRHFVRLQFVKIGGEDRDSDKNLNQTVNLNSSENVANGASDAEETPVQKIRPSPQKTKSLANDAARCVKAKSAKHEDDEVEYFGAQMISILRKLPEHHRISAEMELRSVLCKYQLLSVPVPPTPQPPPPNPSTWPIGMPMPFTHIPSSLYEHAYYPPPNHVFSNQTNLINPNPTHPSTSVPFRSAPPPYSSRFPSTSHSLQQYFPVHQPSTIQVRSVNNYSNVSRDSKDDGSISPVSSVSSNETQ